MIGIAPIERPTTPGKHRTIFPLFLLQKSACFQGFPEVLLQRA
jgi:hypothetical protein